MTHMEDIQKLRQARNMPPFYATSQRFSQPSQPEIYNINLDKFADQDKLKGQHTIKFYDTYTKYIGSKEMLPANNEKKIVHKRGQSNVVPFTERR